MPNLRIATLRTTIFTTKIDIRNGTRIDDPIIRSSSQYSRTVNHRAEYNIVMRM